MLFNIDLITTLGYLFYRRNWVWKQLLKRGLWHTINGSHNHGTYWRLYETILLDGMIFIYSETYTLCTV